jgi:hypothetical protein
MVANEGQTHMTNTSKSISHLPETNNDRRGENESHVGTEEEREEETQEQSNDEPRKRRLERDGMQAQNNPTNNYVASDHSRLNFF